MILGAHALLLLAAMRPDPKNHLFKSGAIDVIGFNYHHQWVKGCAEKNFPGKPFYSVGESVSALQTRGYMMPSDSIILHQRNGGCLIPIHRLCVRLMIISTHHGVVPMKKPGMW